MWQWAWAIAKHNPFSTAASIVAVFVGLPSAIAGYNTVVEPAIPVWRAYMRDHVAEELKPIVLVQSTQAVSIDRFLLYQTQKHLEAVEADPALKTSTNLQNVARELERQIAEIECRIKKASGWTC